MKKHSIRTEVTNDKVADSITMIGNTAISWIHHFIEIPKPDDTIMF